MRFNRDVDAFIYFVINRRPDRVCGGRYERGHGKPSQLGLRPLLNINLELHSWHQISTKELEKQIWRVEMNI